MNNILTKYSNVRQYFEDPMGNLQTGILEDGKNFDLSYSTNMVIDPAGSYTNYSETFYTYGGCTYSAMVSSPDDNLIFFDKSFQSMEDLILYANKWLVTYPFPMTHVDLYSKLCVCRNGPLQLMARTGYESNISLNAKTVFAVEDYPGLLKNVDKLTELWISANCDSDFDFLFTMIRELIKD